MGTEGIQKEMQLFQASIQKLSGGIGRASALWKDEKYAELSASVSAVAGQSRDVLVAGERCCACLERFNSIADESY